MEWDLIGVAGIPEAAESLTDWWERRRTEASRQEP